MPQRKGERPEAAGLGRAGPAAGLVGGLAAGLVVLAIGSLLQALVLLGPGAPGGPAAYDERAFHRPVIEGFVEAWPAPNLREYRVASAPGYHLTVAGVWAAADVPLGVSRWLSGQGALLLAGLVAWWCSGRGGTAFGVLAGVVVLLADSIAPQTVLLLPEAWAWLGVWVLVSLAATPGPGSRRFAFGRLAAMGAVLALLVFVRQVHLWAAALVWMAAWLDAVDRGSHERAFEGLLPSVSELRLRERLPMTAIGFAATVPAFMVVGWLFWLWDGPVPPGFQATRTEPEGSVHSGGNPATPALVLSVLGLYGPMLLTPVLGLIWQDLALRRRAWRLAAIGGAIGLVASLAVATSPDKDAGRWTGLWDLGGRLPIVADRSLLIAGLSAVGGASLGVALSVAASRARLVMLGALVAFTAAQSANQQAWIRYAEPMVLMTMLVLVASALDCRGGPRGGRVRWWLLAGPAVAAVFVATRSLPDLLSRAG
ncbi:MAG: hypothetical protein AAFR96_13220 [Planctomycetota bacterium]